MCSVRTVLTGLERGCVDDAAVYAASVAGYSRGTADFDFAAGGGG